MAKTFTGLSVKIDIAQWPGLIYAYDLADQDICFIFMSSEKTFQFPLRYKGVVGWCEGAAG